MHASCREQVSIRGQKMGDEDGGTYSTFRDLREILGGDEASNGKREDDGLHGDGSNTALQWIDLLKLLGVEEALSMFVLQAVRLVNGNRNRGDHIFMNPGFL